MCSRTRWTRDIANTSPYGTASRKSGSRAKTRCARMLIRHSTRPYSPMSRTSSPRTRSSSSRPSASSSENRSMPLRPALEFFEEGIDLFNEGKFFECHEAWEEVWKRSDGEAKLFYQGIIQAAVAILHAQRGNLNGAASMYAKASSKLDH